MMSEDLPKHQMERERRKGARRRGVGAHDVRVDHRFQEERCHESTLEVEIDVEVVVQLLASVFVPRHQE